MKKRKEIFRLKYFNLCLIVVTLFSSCETYHFAYPLPVDSKNIYKTPRKLRGFIPEEKGSQEGYLLKKHSIETGDNDTLKIIDGIWINPRDTSRIRTSDFSAWTKLYALREYNSRYSIKFDSLKNPIDTVENFILKGSKIYKVELNSVGRGYAFSIRRDTLYVFPEKNSISLGQYVFFRKVSSDIYMLNVSGLFDEDGGSWWRVFVVMKRKDGKVIPYFLKDTIEKDLSLIYSRGSDYYFDSQWTRKDILKLISDGMFEPLVDDKY